mmetsp:Transcript_13371/g.22759  ORF Transcript_13371/g.22759 Transcript_13371/m.22759 type:complete len:304 (-) Transcript_13371:230-1141(-)
MKALKREPAFSIGKASRFDSKDALKNQLVSLPGPGQYDLTKDNDRRLSVHKGNCQFTIPQQMKDSAFLEAALKKEGVSSPGPGSYDNTYKLNAKNTPGGYIGSRLASGGTVDGRASDFVGPGSYERSKKWTTSYRGKVQNERAERPNSEKPLKKLIVTPGPADYDQHILNKMKAPSFKFPTEKRHNLAETGSSKFEVRPDPTSYNTETATSNKNKGFVITGKVLTPLDIQLKQKAEIPAPGQYSSDGFRLMLKSSASYMIGQSKRTQDYKTSNLPGPGAYDMKLNWTRQGGYSSQMKGLSFPK